MLTQEMIKATGEVSISIFDSNGDLKDKVKINNLVVATGRAYIASRMKDDSDAAMSYMAVGTGTTAAALADIDLEAEVNRQLLAGTIANGNVVTYSASFGAGEGTGAITEAGIFNDSSAGTMLCRTVFNVINKAADDSMTVTWTITIS